VDRAAGLTPRPVRAPRRAAGPGPPAGHVVASHHHAPRRGLAEARERLDELVLAVAGDAGYAKDLACPDLQVDAANDLATAIVLHLETAHRQDGIARVRLAAVDGQL